VAGAQIWTEIREEKREYERVIVLGAWGGMTRTIDIKHGENRGSEAMYNFYLLVSPALHKRTHLYGNIFTAAN